jgi:hypothetical protein
MTYQHVQESAGLQGDLGQPLIGVIAEEQGPFPISSINLFAPGGPLVKVERVVEDARCGHDDNHFAAGFAKVIRAAQNAELRRGPDLG